MCLFYHGVDWFARSNIKECESRADMLRTAAIDTIMVQDKSTTSQQKAVLDTTKRRDQLEPRLWKSTSADGDPKLDPDAKKILRQIADRFWDDLEKVNVKLIDIRIVGSCAGYSWQPSSDIDLHLIVKLSGKATIEDLNAAYFKAVGRLWNDQHTVKLYGHPVEIYVQSVDEEHWSSGIFSLQDNKWIREPDPIESDVNKSTQQAIERRVMSLVQQITGVRRRMSLAQSQIDLTRAISDARDLWQRIRQIRKDGLHTGGQTSVGNLAFKTLRRMKLLDAFAQDMRAKDDQLHSLPSKR